jgi:teichuronic acid biosynthesis glycosyltransferase TuaC
MEAMRILSLSTVFPNPSEPGLGIFIERRLQAMAKKADLRVIAPIAPCDYDNPRRRLFGFRSVPFRRTHGLLEVFHPAWVYLPGNRFTNGILLGLQLAPLLRRLCREFPFAWIDAHFAHPDGVAAAVLASFFRCRFTITMRGNELINVRYPLRRVLMGWALRKANLVFALSNDLAQLARDLGVRPEVIRRVRNGIDPNLYTANSGRPSGSRQPAIIVSVGRLVESKGHQHTIKAVANLRARGIDVDLRILGEEGRGSGGCSAKLRSLREELRLSEHVQLLGWRPPSEVAAEMAAADVVCHASVREGWPNVVQEALACGTPVVATDVGSTREIIPDARYGLLVPLGSPDALEQALELSLKRQWDRSVIASWGKVWSWDIVAGGVISELETIGTAGR